MDEHDGSAVVEAVALYAVWGMVGLQLLLAVYLLGAWRVLDRFAWCGFVMAPPALVAIWYIERRAAQLRRARSARE